VHSLELPETLAGSPARLLRGHTGGEVLTRPHLEMEAELLLDLALQAPLAAAVLAATSAEQPTDPADVHGSSSCCAPAIRVAALPCSGWALRTLPLETLKKLAQLP
jgi:hypothetical protein